MIDLEPFIYDNRDRIALVVSVSGGKDSTRMLGFLRAQFRPSQPIASWRIPASSTSVRFERWTGHSKWPRGSASNCTLSATRTRPIWRWFGVSVNFPPRNSGRPATRSAVRSRNSSANCPSCGGPSHRNACPGVASACASAGLGARQIVEQIRQNGVQLAAYFPRDDGSGTHMALRK